MVGGKECVLTREVDSGEETGVQHGATTTQERLEEMGRDALAGLAIDSGDPEQCRHSLLYGGDIVLLHRCGARYEKLL